jgi:hypothetical protein
MTSVVHHDIGVWMARVPLIHFWIISHHYRDKVMRQFEFFLMDYQMMIKLYKI